MAKTDKSQRWMLRAYERNGERMVSQVELAGIGLGELQQLFGQDQGNPMYDCYPVTAKQAPALQKYVSTRIQPAAFDYFVECDALEDKT